MKCIKCDGFGFYWEPGEFVNVGCNICNSTGEIKWNSMKKSHRGLCMPEFSEVDFTGSKLRLVTGT